MTAPFVSIVVPVWDEPELTERCVTSIRRNTDGPYELIGIDNGSTEPASSMVANAFDVAVRNGENLGFARAMNQGLELATGRYVLFLNNDTEVPAGWATPLVQSLEAHGVGLVVPAVTAAGNSYSVRAESGEGVVTIPPFTEIPSGVAYAMSTGIARALGGWSEDYDLASGEDLDLLFTVWANGLSVVLDERVLIHHHSAATAAKLPNRTELWRANRALFIDKWKSADPARIPIMTGADATAYAANLEKAALAATWMERWFKAKDALHDVLHPPED